MSRQLFRQRISDCHGVDQDHYEEGEKVQAGDQIADFFAVVMIDRAGDPYTGRHFGRQDELTQRFVRPVG